VTCHRGVLLNISAGWAGAERGLGGRRSAIGVLAAAYVCWLAA
jgi:hypothetical protein